jgi:sigma-B regulation protein RsbU (phosphoserine phosphatase)
VDEIGDDHFVTLFFAHLDPAQRRLVYAAAGQRSYLLHADGTVRILDSTAPPLGLDELLSFPTAPTITLQPGDLLFLTTDGVEEAIAPNGKFYGIQRALDLVHRCRHQRSRDLVETLYEDICTFTDNCTQQDDLTAIILKVDV